MSLGKVAILKEAAVCLVILAVWGVAVTLATTPEAQEILMLWTMCLPLAIWTRLLVGLLLRIRLDPCDMAPNFVVGLLFDGL